MSGGGGPVHDPVLAGYVVRIFADGGVRFLLDATVGAGGHSAAFLESGGGETRVLGLDRDPEMLETARARLAPFGDRAVLANRSFADLESVLDDLGEPTVDGALFDLGASSVHFDRPERGFSFLAPGPLDMRFDRTRGETAEDIVNRLPEEKLAEILRDYGDEHQARRVARAIVRARPMKDTLRLADTVAGAVSSGGRIHPATRTFQALRIAVNRELDQVEKGIPAAVRRLRPGGRLVVISFHSGEDRLVKRLFREEERAGRVALLEKKPVRPERDEIHRNARARSARLRACERKTGEAE